jgi:hypothetical protein
MFTPCTTLFETSMMMMPVGDHEGQRLDCAKRANGSCCLVCPHLVKVSDSSLRDESSQGFVRSLIDALFAI